MTVFGKRSLTTKRRQGVSCALFLVAGFCCGCSQAPRQHDPANNLVLVTIDTLRADYVGAYGAEPSATPRLDGIADAGALAWEATCHVPITLPSHASLLAGRLPPAVGLRDNTAVGKIPPIPLLAEVLKNAGFTTGAFVSSVVLASSTGLDRGFDIYSDEFDTETKEPLFLSTIQKRGDVTTAEAIAWLEKVLQEPSPSPTQRLFLWLHLFDPHDPYEPPEPYASRYPEMPYTGEVAWSDELVGRLDDAIGRLGIEDDTLLVVTSDHGEGLGDHGEELHGFFVYQSTLHVPLLVRAPGVVPGTRLHTTVRLVDIYPTVLDLLGVAPPASSHLDGRSLASALRGHDEPEEPVTYAESLVPLLHFGWSDLRVVREGRWKYIQAPRPELFDLEADPNEQNNLVGTHGSRATAMRSTLNEILKAERVSAEDEDRSTAVPPELLEQLGALGYVAGTTAAENRMPGIDPKDKIEEAELSNHLIRQGIFHLQARDFEASVHAFNQVLAGGVRGFAVHLFLARGLLALGRAREARDHFEEVTRMAPMQGEAWEGLSDSLAAASDEKAALAAVKRGLERLPEHVGLRTREAQLLSDLGRRSEARQAYEAVLPLVPNNAQLRFELGELLRDMGDIDQALLHLGEAVELDPSIASYWNSLGVTLGGAARYEEAEAAFGSAVAREPYSHRYLYNLGFSLVLQGRSDEARGWFEKSLAANPSFTPARERLDEIARTRGPQ